MARTVPFDYFCHPDSPEDFQRAVREGDHHALVRWCRDHPHQIGKALDWIHPNHDELRKVVSIEIEAHRFKEVERRLVAIERTHWTVLPTFYLTAIGVILAGLAAWFGWLAVPRLKPQGDAKLPSSSSTQTTTTPP